MMPESYYSKKRNGVLALPAMELLVLRLVPEAQ
jgi:hypothetical protein